MKERERDHNTDPDVALMLAARDGDEEAFVTLYRQYRDKLFNFARRLLGDAAVAEEATQDVFLKLYRARTKYEPRSRFSTYLFRIATNHCFNVLARKEHKLVDRNKMVEVARNPESGPEERVAQTELRRVLNAALGSLPEKQAAALVLSHYEGMSHHEVAEVLGVSESAVKSLVFRAREALMSKLGPEIAEVREVSHAV